jgi:ribosomal protein S18 acetylase RimI-like enzyme
MNLNVRRAKKSDFRFLKEVMKEHIKTTFPGFKYDQTLADRHFRKEIQKPGAFVLTLDRKVIGYLHLGFGKHFGIPVGELHSIHILKQYRGKGYSHVLMKYVEDYFKKKKAKIIALSTNLDNTTARSLYKKHGYKNWRIRMKKVIG